MSAEPKYWFKPKSHGLGAYPTHWKGWAVIAAYCVLNAVITIWLIVNPANTPEGPGVVRVVVWFVLLFGGIAVLIRVTRAKTEGAWRWRWGRKN